MPNQPGDRKPLASADEIRGVVDEFTRAFLDDVFSESACRRVFRVTPCGQKKARRRRSKR